MKRLRVGVFVAVMASVLLFSGNVFASGKVLKMSTTTSTQSSGLLDILLPALEKDTGITVKVIAKGTGAAIRDGIDGNVDVIFVHARGREDKFVSDGYGTKRYGVMHNDFVVLGPDSDPAGIKGMTDAGEALKKIAASGSKFISRGDDSGTHTKEQILWKASGLKTSQVKTTITKKGKKKDITSVQPVGDFYMSIGQGMGKTVTFTEEKQAYTLSDRGTFIKYKFGRDAGLDLDVLCEGDAGLSNPYGVIPVSPKVHPHVKYDLAVEFAEWLVSEKGQKVIQDYRLVGKQLFYPDAIK